MTPIKRKKLKGQFLEAYENSTCNVSVCCKKIGISRNCFYQWKKEDDDFSESITELEEGLMDFAETMLYKGIKEGKTAELIFYLKTKAKGRGYVERHEHTDLTEREPIEVTIVHPKNEDTSNDELSKD